MARDDLLRVVDRIRTSRRKDLVYQLKHGLIATSGEFPHQFFHRAAHLIKSILQVSASHLNDPDCVQ